MKNQTILLNARPEGLPKLTDFVFEDCEMPVISDGQMLLKTCYISVDPYLRGRMNDVESYVPPFELGETISSGLIAEVVDSKLDGFDKGDFVSGLLGWNEYQCSNGEGLSKIDKNGGQLSAYLGILGMPGLTAYLGLMEIGKPQAGETVLVSGAAGAVGSAVGQIAKIMGCRVVGIAGSDEKVAMLKSTYGFDEGINYKTVESMSDAIKSTCPDGVDVYFDNVGGQISDAVLFNINKFARLIICGAISVYNDNNVPKGVSPQPFLIKNSALMQGFIVFNYVSKYGEALEHLSKWLMEGKIIYKETIVEGFDQTPQAFIDLFEGKNQGKMVVKVV